MRLKAFFFRQSSSSFVAHVSACKVGLDNCALCTSVNRRTILPSFSLSFPSSVAPASSSFSSLLSDLFEGDDGASPFSSRPQGLLAQAVLLRHRFPSYSYCSDLIEGGGLVREENKAVFFVPTLVLPIDVMILFPCPLKGGHD